MWKFIENKYVIFGLIAVFLFVIFKTRSCQQEENDKLQEYNRQLSGQLSDKERELQEANESLDVLKSEFVSQSELNKRLKAEKEGLSSEFNAFVKKHNLEIKSRDKTILSLKQQITDGTSTVEITDSNSDFDCGVIKHNCVLSYSWTDKYHRFSLMDIDIFVPDNEVFLSKQLFKVYGEVWKEKNGNLKVRRLILKEVVEEDGAYRELGQAEILESSFEYNTDLEIEKGSWRDLFRIRAIMLASVTAFPDLAYTRFGLGMEFFNWRGVGINTHSALNFKDVKKWEQRIGISYSPKFKKVDLNFAFGISAGTPFSNLFREVSVNGDLIFYLNN